MNCLVPWKYVCFPPSQHLKRMVPSPSFWIPSLLLKTNGTNSLEPPALPPLCGQVAALLALIIGRNTQKGWLEKSLTPPHPHLVDILPGPPFALSHISWALPPTSISCTVPQQTSDPNKQNKIQKKTSELCLHLCMYKYMCTFKCVC